MRRELEDIRQQVSKDSAQQQEEKENLKKERDDLEKQLKELMEDRDKLKQRIARFRYVSRHLLDTSFPARRFVAACFSSPSCPVRQSGAPPVAASAIVRVFVWPIAVSSCKCNPL